ncbi:MAG: TetR/AcrR family transcriptional regulator [Luteolibacter sp.]|jgi:AcrR family transcriptional regulator|nr:TetR/AcrR family transcriptional regulator [Luteolibacter sp.]
MREIKFPQSGPKRRLLDVAEALFAERGFEAVSVRDITNRAKANVAAVNYHFGSREQLIALVIIRHLSPLTEERMARLETVEKKWAGKAPPLEEIIDAMVRPLLGAVRKSELPENQTCKVMGRIFALQGEEFPQETETQMQNSINRFIRVLSRSLPSLTGEELHWRTHFVLGGLIHMLLRQDLLQRTSQGNSGMPTLEATLGRFIRFAAAGLREGVEMDASEKKGPQATFDF